MLHLKWDASIDVGPLYYRMQYSSPMHDHLLLSQTERKIGYNVGQLSADEDSQIAAGVIDSVVMQPFCKLDYECLRGYKIYYGVDESGAPYTGTGLNEGDSPIYAGDNLEFILTGFAKSTTYYFVVTAYSNENYNNLLESDYSNEFHWTSGGSGSGAPNLSSSGYSSGSSN